MSSSFQKQFDYIIAGAGAAGLSLLVRLINAGLTAHKRILLVDKAPKARNDRTWCFWEEKEGFFEDIVYHHWETLWFYGNALEKKSRIDPYHYKMIRGIDFYNYCFSKIDADPNVEVIYGTVTGMRSGAVMASLNINGKPFSAGHIFNSIIFSNDYLQEDQNALLQHFKGWNITTKKPVFNAKEATLMDFRVKQPRGAAFVYTMPFSSNTALVEHTLFSKNLLPDAEYDQALAQYIRDFITDEEYTVNEREFGIIPMTGYPFKPREGRIIHIGTMGGQTKASSGYTFQFIQRHTASLVERIIHNDLDSIGKQRSRYKFYDKVLLNVLATGKVTGEEVFTRLFRKNNTNAILAFLDNDTTLVEDLSLIRTLPIWPFLKAAVEEF